MVNIFTLRQLMVAISNFIKIGNDLFLQGLNNSHSGNISCKISNTHMLITRTGAMLHRLSSKDIIKTGIFENDLNTNKASRELPVHRHVYKHTNYKAVVHAHPPFTVALSIIYDIIHPIDAEGKYYFQEGIKCIEVCNPIASCEVAEVVVANTNKLQLALIKGHGVFAVGETLEDAYHWISSFEHSCKILYLHNVYKLSVTSDFKTKF